MYGSVWLCMALCGSGLEIWHEIDKYAASERDLRSQMRNLRAKISDLAVITAGGVAVVLA